MDGEKEALFTAVEEYGPSWTFVSKKIKGRNAPECKRRYFRLKAQEMKDGFEKEMTEQCFERLQSKHSWFEVDVEDPGISNLEYLSSRIKGHRFRREKIKEGWTLEEDLTLREGYESLGPDWEQIAYRLPHRTGVQCRNRMMERYFGKEVLTEVLRGEVSENEISTLHKRIYEEYILTYDAVDNGVSQYPTDITPKYKSPSDIFKWVNRLNPAWNSKEKDTDSAFLQAMNVVGEDFLQTVRGYVDHWLPAKNIVVEAISGCGAHSGSNEILDLPLSCPWKEHLFDYEKENGQEGRFKYVVFPDETNGDWRIQAVPVQPESFECRRPLPSAWRGLRDNELDRVLNTSGSVFCHASGFIGGHRTKEGALLMAKLALGGE